MKTTKLILSAAALVTFCVPSLFAQDINQRKDNQQDRISQGVKSGQLTAGETAHLETKEAGINREERGMRAEDNGHLTKGDRRLINHQQNHLSRQIYNKKHNGRTR